MLNRIRLLLIALSVTMTLSAQLVDRNIAFKPGEVMKLDAYFNLGLIWMKVGTATFTVEEENDNYKFTVKADNLPKWDWLYEVHTLHVASCTKDMRPLYMWSKVTEKGKYSEDRFDYEDKGDHYVVRRHAMGEKHPDGFDTTFTIPAESHDIINAVYVARNVDLTINNGKDIPFYPMFNYKSHTIWGNVIGTKKITTREKVKYDCIECTAHVGVGTIFDADHPVHVWITDDDRHVPVLVESKLSFGTVRVYLGDYKEGK